jgi:hypothetical protein
MSIRSFRDVYRCPECQKEVSPNQEKCPSQHTLHWDQAAVRGALTANQKPNTPVKSSEPMTQWGVFALYVLIVLVIGFALAYSLYKGSDYMNFSSALVTALTTIAGFAVGVNSGTSGQK